MPNASAHPGMGAIVHDAGVAFRVWAPNADAVFVIGTFNDWSEDAAAMARGGRRRLVRRRARRETGDEYRFLIHNGDAELSRIDPYARAVTNSVGNGVVVDPAHDWHGDDFEMRGLERAGHLRDARRHLPPSRRGDGRAPSPTRSRSSSI